MIGRIAAVLFATALAGCATMETSVDPARARSELAPTGKIRLAVITNNPNYLNQPMQQPYSGIAVDIGNALSKRIGAPMELVMYRTIGAILADAPAGKWDATLIGIEDSRRAVLEYSVAYAVTPNSYMVPAGSALMTIPAVDRGGVRIAASKGTIQHAHLKANLKSATVVDTATVTASVAELKDGRVDAIAANRPTLEDLAAKMPGYRVLPGSFMDVQYGMAVPKGRSAAAAQVDRLIREMRANGEIAAAIARANVKGLAVPPN
jgi:polar amino acid transport system substrate-binding protein